MNPIRDKNPRHGQGVDWKTTGRPESEGPPTYATTTVQQYCTSSAMKEKKTGRRLFAILGSLPLHLC